MSKDIEKYLLHAERFLSLKICIHSLRGCSQTSRQASQANAICPGQLKKKSYSDILRGEKELIANELVWYKMKMVLPGSYNNP
jgi:hypothetical protein